jgi:hypothetical protein
MHFCLMQYLPNLLLCGRLSVLIKPEGMYKSTLHTHTHVYWNITSRNLRCCKQESQWTYNRNIAARSFNHCCRGKAISITYCECVSVALIIQHVKNLRSITLSPKGCLAISFFSTLFYKRHFFFRIKFLKKNACCDFLYNYVWNILHYKKKWASYDQNSILVFMSSTRYSFQILRKL